MKKQYPKNRHTERTNSGEIESNFQGESKKRKPALLLAAYHLHKKKSRLAV